MKNNDLKGSRRTFLVIALAFIVLLLAQNTLALEINPFAIKKTFEETPTADTGDFVKEKVKDFGVVKFKKTIFWIESEKLSEETLTKHDYSCFIDCESEGRITIYQDAVLFDSLKFYDTQGLERAKDGKMFIKEKESYFIDVPDTYKQVCEQANGTQSCRQEVDNYKQEERFKDKWVEYDGSIKPAGDYEYKIKVSKKPNEKLDFVYSHFGKEVREYAWFNQSWNYSRPVYMNLTAGSTSNNTLWLNITNMTNMLSNGCDIRFTDLTNTTELKHWAEANSSSSWILEQINITNVTVNTTNQTVAMLYYGNSGASCNGNITTAFTFGDDFNANTVASYSTHGSGTLTWNSAGYFYDANAGLGGGITLFYPTSLASFNINGYRAVCRQMINTTATQVRVGVGMFNASNPTSNVFFRGMWDNPAQFISEVVTGGAGTNSGANRTISANTWYVSELSPQGSAMVIRDAYIGSNASYSNNLSDNGNTTYSISGLTPIFTFGTRHLVSQPRWDYCYLAPYYPGRLASSLGQEASIGLIVTSVAPSNQTNFSQNTIYFTTNITDPVNVGLQNVSLYINGTLNTTNSSHIIGVTNFTGIALQDGYYNYTFFAYDNSSLIYQSSNGTLFFSVDTTGPTINITYPIGTILFHNISDTLQLNWTASDPHLSYCWYQYNGVNTTVTCSAGTTTFQTIASQKNITFWANDTLGNIASDFQSWDYELLLTGESYSASTVEGNTETFVVNLTTNGTGISSAYLSYNGTLYAGSSSVSSNSYIITRNITVPSVTVDTNLTFFWNITMADGYTKNITSHNQTVYDLNVDNCSNMTGRYVLYNFTIKDERLQTQLNSSYSSAEVDLNIYTSDGVSFVNYSADYNATNPFAVCLTNNLTGSSYILDAQIQYNGILHAQEFYNIQQETLTSADLSTNITLYDLLDTESQEFQITYKDRNFIPVQDAIIQIQRKYIDEGTFKVVEIPKTDSSGTTLAHLGLSDVVYTFVVVKNGVVLSTYENQLAYCNNVATGDCTISLYEITSSAGVQGLINSADYSFSIVPNRTARTITASFVVLSGTSATNNLNVTLFDGYGNTSICSSSVVSSSGQLVCSLPQAYDNYTVFAVLKKDGVQKGMAVIPMSTDPDQIYGNSRIFLALLGCLALIGVGITESPIIMGVLLIVGVIFMTLLNLVASVTWYGAGATILWFIVAVAVVLVKGGKR